MRIQESDDYIAWFNRHAPQARFTHGYGNFEPEEEIIIMEHFLSCGFMLTFAYVPTFLYWWASQDFRPSYRFLKRALQYLQWQFHSQVCKRWILKCPIHLGYEQYLTEIFTDATLVTTNRDPISAVTSSMSTIHHYYKAYSDVDHRSSIGPLLLEGRAAILDQHMDNRDADVGLRFLDIGYPRITNDTESVIEDIYAHAGMQLSDIPRTAMRRWDKEHSREKLGTHRYSLQEYSISEFRLNKRFARYSDRFRSLF